jgi:hypothetical protein
VINLMGAVGGIMVLGMVALLAPDKANINYWPLFLGTAGVMVVGVIILKLTVNEPAEVIKMRHNSATLGIDVEEAEHDDTLVTHERLPKEYRKSLIFYPFVGRLMVYGI